jgi:tetratricopeptide (TPR) repeat protein
VDCFVLLNIEPTTDIKKIKRAYSEMLKVYSPETDPEGFQSLRAAYTEALARISDEETDSNKSLSPVDEFMEKFAANYANYEKRLDFKEWKELLESDICYHIDTSEEVSHRILGFISEQYYFPHEIWVLFNSYFSWTAKKDRLYTQFNNNFIDFLIRQINTSDLFRFELLLQCDNGQQEKFIREYFNGCRSLNGCDYYATKVSIETAEAICPEHPDLLILTARNLMVNGKLDEAHTLLSSIITSHPDDLYAHYYRGNLLFRLGKFSESYSDYLKVIAGKPDFTDVLFSLGKCCVSLGLYEEALEYLNKLKLILHDDHDVNNLSNAASRFLIEQIADLSAANPDDAGMKYKLAKAYSEINNTEESYKILCELEQQNQMTGKIYELFCHILFRMDKKELALSTLNSAIEKYPEDYELIFLKASFLDEFDKHEDVLFYYEKAALLKSTDPLLYNNKAYSLNKLGRYNEALESASKAIELDPNMAHGYKNKAEALLGLELYEACFEACERALNLFLYLTDVYVIKMKVLIRTRQFEEAFTVFNKARDFGLTDNRLDHEKANILYFSGKYDDAIRSYNLILEADPGNGEINYYKGRSLFYNENYEEATHCFEQVTHDKFKEEALFYRILSLFNCFKYDEAFIEAENAIQLNLSKKDRFHDMKGEVLNKQGKHKEAIYEYKQAIELNPESAVYYFSMASALNDIDSFIESLEYIDKCIEIEPSRLEAYIVKSYSHFKLDEYMKCIEQCDIALELDPNNLAAMQNRGSSLKRLGRKQDAEEMYIRGLKINPNYYGLLFLKLLILGDKGLIQDALIVSDRILEISPNDEDTINQRKKLMKMNKPKRSLFNLFS